MMIVTVVGNYSMKIEPLSGGYYKIIYSAWTNMDTNENAMLLSNNKLAVDKLCYLVNSFDLSKCFDCYYGY